MKKYLKVWMGEDDSGYLEKKYEIVQNGNYQYLAYNYGTKVGEEHYELTELDAEKLEEYHKQLKREEEEKKKVIEIQRLEKKSRTP